MVQTTFSARGNSPLCITLFYNTSAEKSFDEGGTLSPHGMPGPNPRFETFSVRKRGCVRNSFLGFMSPRVIVESPAKAKTIGKYPVRLCRQGFTGHLRDLPKKKMSIDIEHDFQPEYVPIEGKDKIIKEIRSEIRKSDFVYLATDPDREGEAISWHIKELFKLKDKNSRRVTFNEITKQAVRSGIENPRDIDIDLVNAQQARRILDRIVGYQLSPFLWRKVKRGLSAGRVQSVATRLVVDRENEIRAFVPEEYWSIEALLQTADGGRFSARYYGDANGKA